MTEAVFGKIITSVLLGAFAVTMARNAFGKRHWIAWHIARFLIFFVAIILILLLVKATGLRGWWIEYAAIGLAAPVYCGWKWQRSRWIPVAKRRKAIAKWETRTGKRFDPKTYEIDHIVPFARGGWHTGDNLRVVRRDANRRKGGKEPTLEDWFRIWSRKDEQ